MRDDRRNADQLELGTCPMCGDTFPIDGRSIYCTPVCRQRAFRLRNRSENRQTLTALATTLRRQQRLTAQTVYECPACSERFLGQRRCDDCNLWCRKVGLGGECSNCAEILTIADLLSDTLEEGDATI
jgi:ribosomal protein L32